MQLTALVQPAREAWVPVLGGSDGFLLCLVWVLPADGNKCNRVAEQNSFLTVPEERVHTLEEVCAQLWSVSPA